MFPPSPRAALAVGFALLAVACASDPRPESEAPSEEHPPRLPVLSAQVRGELEERLAEAHRRWEEAPTDEMAIVWRGRRLAYLGRYDEAIAAYTIGIELHPASYRLRRHRGHRYITTRRFDLAIADLTRAAELAAGFPDEVEPDGMPNARGIPVSTTHGNIFYHLGLAHYLRGDLPAALAAYGRCAEFGDNDDHRCSTAYWRAVILRRLGRDAEAAAVLEEITEGMDLIENHAYHELALLLKGVRHPSDFAPAAADAVHGAEINDATTAYGLSMWFLVEGDEARAATMWADIVGNDAAWAAFGFIAAEAALARLERR